MQALVTLVANTVVQVPLEAPTGRVVVTIVDGTPAPVFVTADGTDPIVPASGVVVGPAQSVIPAVVGEAIVVQPPFPGDGMVLGTISLLSTGTPTVSVEW